MIVTAISDSNKSGNSAGSRDEFTKAAAPMPPPKR